MARDVKKALERLEQALEDEEYEEELDEDEEYDEDDENEEYEDDEDFEEYEAYEEAPPAPGERNGCLKALVLLLMTAIAVMLLVITMKIKGMIP